MVYHQKVKAPLFHTSYEVLVGPSMIDLVDHVQEMFPGLNLKDEVSPDSMGYSLFITNRKVGSSMLALIVLRDDQTYPTVYDTIVHESVHLSWAIIDLVGVKINEDNHEVQAYLVEQINFEIRKVLEIAKKEFASDESQEHPS